MFNTRFGKFRTKKKKYTIFVDETSSYDASIGQSGNAYPTNFITTFCVLDAINVKKFNKSYRNKIYANNSKKEIKSLNVSDKTNRLALQVAEPYLVYALVFERKVHYFQAYDTLSPDIHFALDLYSYFNPLENILQYLASLNPNVDLLIHLKLDEVTYFKTPNHFKLIKSYLHDLENKYTNADHNLQFIFEMVDSQQHMGIQLADMLAGAYRKEEQYEVSGEKVKLIPFDYQLQISNQNLEHDTDFLKMYGLLSFSQVLDSVAQKNAIKAQSNHVEKAYISGNLKHVASSNVPVETNAQTKIHPLQHLDMLVQKHRFNKNLKKTRRSLTTCLANNSDTGFRQKTTPYLVSLSKAILENVENTNGQFAKVKQKDNPTTYQKNIVVLFNNLNKLTNLDLEADSIYLINQALKRFNHRIPN